MKVLIYIYICASVCAWNAKHVRVYITLRTMTCLCLPEELFEINVTHQLAETMAQSSAGT